MKRSALENMTKDELAEYAEIIGLKVGNLPKKAIVDRVLEHANRVVSITVAGFTLDVDVSTLDDMRNSEAGIDLKSVNGLIAAARAFFGEEQEAALRAYVTDDNGKQDKNLYAYIAMKAIEQVNTKN